MTRDEALKIGRAAIVHSTLPAVDLWQHAADVVAGAVYDAIDAELNPPMCLAEYVLPIGGPLKCTLAPGHEGDHDASGCQTWPNQPNSGGAVAGDGSSTT